MITNRLEAIPGASMEAAHRMALLPRSALALTMMPAFVRCSRWCRALSVMSMVSPCTKDFTYDDGDTVYPDDIEHYAGNAADQMEFHLAVPRQGGLAVRFALNTLMVADSTTAVVAFDSDDAATGSGHTAPRSMHGLQGGHVWRESY